MTSAVVGKIWRFGAVEFDERAAAVRAGGASVSLDRSCAAILSALLAARGEVVSKDRLLEAGWPGRVVHENSLAKAIGRLRKALGPEAEHLRVIYGAGYSLTVEAEQVDAAAPSRATGRFRLLPFAAAAAVFVAGAIAVTLALPGAGTKAEDETLLRLTEPDGMIGRILWVDDHPENNVTEKAAFEERDIAVYTVASTDEALTLLSMYPHYDAVISDMGRNGEPLAGFKLLEEMRAREDPTPFYLYTIMTSDAQRELLAGKGGQGAAETREELYGFIVPLMEQKMAER